MPKTNPLKWSTVKRIVSELLPLSFNPRKITEEKKEALIESLKEFNLVEIPIIDIDNTLIAGNQRVMALALMGRESEKIDVRIPNRKLTIRELKRYNLISNTHAGEFDAELLEAHFEDIEILFDIPEWIDDQPKTKMKMVGQTTMEKIYFLNIKCSDEEHCQELFDELAQRGLEVKIIT